MSIQETETGAHFTAHNDHLNVAVTKRPHCQVKFDIDIQPQAVKAAYHKAIKNVNKEVSLPGFRKGRAPETLILEKYASVIHKEFVDLVLNTGFQEAVQLTHLQPLRDGKMQPATIKECSKEKGASFTIEFESRPSIPSVKIEDLHIQKMTPAVITDQEVQNALQNLLLRFATYDPIENRPVQENDFIDVSVTLLEEIPQEVISNQRTQVNATGLPIWLRQKVMGLQAGESAEGMTEQDPNLVEPDPHFHSLPFRVTVHAIWQGNLPAVDEALAKRVGLQSVEDLHKKIYTQLEQEAQEEAFKKETRALEQLLIEKYPFDLPESYIENYKKTRLKGYLEELEKQQRTYSQEDYQSLEKSIEESSISQLQLFFLLRKIAFDYQVQVNNQDISEELMRQIALIPNGQAHLKLEDREALREQLHQLAFDRKIRQFIVDRIAS